MRSGQALKELRGFAPRAVKGEGFARQPDYFPLALVFACGCDQGNSSRIKIIRLPPLPLLPSSSPEAGLQIKDFQTFTIKVGLTDEYLI